MAALTFEGTLTADLQVMHDNLVAFMKGTKVGAGIGQYTIAGRSVTSFSPTEAMTLISALSNELARRALQAGGARDDFYDTSFSDGGMARRPGW